MNEITEKELSAFVGPKADYYLQKWHLAVDGTGRVTGFNWPALIISGLWLPYRKMYRITWIFLGIILLEAILEKILYEGVLGQSEAPGDIGRFIAFVASIACGGFANEWYLSHARKSIEKIRSLGLPEETYFEVLAKQGGTNLAASLATLVFFLLGTFAALFLLELLMNGIA